MVLNPDDHDTWVPVRFFTNPIVDAARAPEILDRIRTRLGKDVTIPQYPAPMARVKLSAGWLIERAGFAKGHPGEHAPARQPGKTLALTNRGPATTEDHWPRVPLESATPSASTYHPEPVLVGCEINACPITRR